MLGASAIGGVFSALAGIFPWMDAILRFLLLNVAVAVLMIWTAFGRMKKREMVKQVIALYLITYLAGGLINSIYYYTDVREKLFHIGNSLILSNLSWKMILPLMLAFIPAAFLILWMHRWYQSERKETYEVELYYKDQSIHTKGLMDSGNCLYDPIFKKPVMVIENRLLQELLPAQKYQELEAVKNCLDGNDMSELPEIGNEYGLSLKFIPYQSIGKEKGMMLGLVLDKVIVHSGKETLCNERVTAAICDNHLSVKDDYHILLHKELI
jgi:Sporulation factor SpoIIGA.